MAFFSKPLSIWVGAFVAATIGAVLVLPEGAASERLDFEHAGDELAGHLVLPDGKGPHPAVIFVHGDGPAVWDEHGFYQPFMDAFTAAGYAVFAWDKPGVGGSGGNWLHQSMQDRASEVVAAAAVLRDDPRIQPGRIGMLGFSQAGWVAPKAAAQEEFSFLVSVSGAINWMEQSKYSTRNRMTEAGSSEADIRSALVFDRLLVGLMQEDASYRQFTEIMNDAPSCCRDIMSEDRWAFVKKNFESDARDDLRRVQIPVLGIFGYKDRNVDAVESARVYAEILERNNSASRVLLLENADHMLLETETGSVIAGRAALLRQWVRVLMKGDAAFAGDAPNLIVRWVADLGES